MNEELQQQMDAMRSEKEALKSRVSASYPSLDIHATVWEFNGKPDATVGIWLDGRCVSTFRTWEEFERIVQLALVLVSDRYFRHYKDFDPFNASPTDDELNKY